MTSGPSRRSPTRSPRTSDRSRTPPARVSGHAAASGSPRSSVRPAARARCAGSTWARNTHLEPRKAGRSAGPPLGRDGAEDRADGNAGSADDQNVAAGCGLLEQRLEPLLTHLRPPADGTTGPARV